MATLYKRSRSPFWQARVVVGGRSKRISTNTTNSREAQKAADEAEDELNQLLVSEADLRIMAAAERFFAYKTELRPKTVINYKSSLTSLVGVLGDFPLKLLDETRLKHYVEVRSTKTGSVAIRRDLAFLSSLYKTARGWTNGPTTNPVRDFDKSHLKNAVERTRWLTPQEFDQVLAACKTPTQTRVVTLLLETGLRISELLGLEWEAVDFRYRQIVIFGDKTKNGDYRIVPLTGKAFDTLQDTVRNATSDYVFVNPKTGKPLTTFQKCWVGICQRSGVANCTIHTLRHTFASWGLQRGMGEIPLQHWLGHKTRSMTKRYAKSSYDSLQAAAAVFSGDTLDSTLDITIEGERK